MVGSSQRISFLVLLARELALLHRVTCLEEEKRYILYGRGDLRPISIYTLPILPMGFQSGFRLVAGKIRSPPVPGCTACPGILAESCKRADSTLSRLVSRQAIPAIGDENGVVVKEEEGEDGKRGRRLLP